MLKISIKKELLGSKTMDGELMNGWLITNAFLNTNKFSEINLWLLEAAKKQGIDLLIKTNVDILPLMDDKLKLQLEHSNTPDFILFWDKDIRLAKYLENKGFVLFNQSSSIASSDDKALTHLMLQNEGIPMPKTILAPMTYGNIGYTNLDFLEDIHEQLGFPLILKECFGSFGMQVYKINTMEELIRKTKELQGVPILFQKYIKSSSGRDVRLQVVGNQVVAAMYRYSDTGDFRANITNGGKMKPYDPTKEQIEIALHSCRALGLDFAGVDILFGEHEEAIVCEVNSNAHFKNIYDCTGINVADCIMEYIIKKIILIKK